VVRSGERGGEIEAEAVHVHLADPVAQAVHHQLDDVGLTDVERVAGAGVVDVVARALRARSVVGLVVQATHGQDRAAMVALPGVVVDDVEDDLQAGRVQGPHHGLELVHLLPGGPARGVVAMRGEEADGVVAPVLA